MSTYEDRLVALEQKVADIELERLYEKRKAAQSTPSEQAYDAKQVNHRLTMLLGISSGQEKDISDMKKRLISIDERLNSLETKFDEHATILSQHTILLTQILERLPEKFS